MKQIYKLLMLFIFVASTTLLADDPYATNLAISGISSEGQTLTGSYLYGDIDGDAEAGTVFKWWRSATKDTSAGVALDTAITQALTAAEIGNYIGFSVKPKNATDDFGAVYIVWTTTQVTANQAPVASAVNFTGQLSYGAQLTGSYTYSDFENDAKGTSTFQWRVANDASGTGAVNATGTGATTLNYTVALADVGKYLALQVTPVASAGTTPGTAALSAYKGPIGNNQAPTANNVNITGNPNKTQQLTGGYTYSDAEGDLEGTSTYQWYVANDASGGGRAAATGVGNTTTLYTVATGDETKWVQFEVVVVASTGTFTDGTKYVSPYVQIVNDPPTFANASYTPNTSLNAGDALTGSTGAFNDLDGDGAGVHTYQWYRSDTPGGLNKIAIPSATTTSYTLTNNDVGKYISFGATPVAASGASPGSEVESALAGPVGSYPLTIPTLSAPANLAVDQSLTPTFSFAGGGANTVKYQFQLATDQFFVNIIDDDATIAYTGATINDVYDGPALSNNTKYYWRVRAYNDVAAGGPFYSPWSTIWSFTTLQNITPSLSYPIANATVYTASPTVYWYVTAFVPGMTYDVYWRVSPAGGWSSQTGLGSTNYTITNLSPGETYDWYVVAHNGSNNATSATEQFTIDGSVAGAAIVPTPSYPTAGVAVYTLTPSLHWYLGVYATGLIYDVDVATDNSFSNIIYSVSGISTLSTTTIPLSPSTTYYWRVRSKSGATTSGWSATSSFITTASANGSVVVPVPSYPIGGPLVYTTQPTLNWYLGTYATGLTYEVQVDDDINFTTPDHTNSGITTLYDVVTGGLSEGVTYYWRVRSSNGIINSAWSPVNSFTIYTSTVVAGMGTPILTFPIGGATLINNSPQLFWYTLGATSNYEYDLKVSKYPDLSSPDIDLNGGSRLTTNYYNATGLTYGVTYYWAVRAYNSVTTTYSDWSTTESFVTPPASASPIIVPNPGSPVAGVTVEGEPQLSWFLPAAAEGLTYDLQISEDPNFIDNAVEITNIAEKQIKITPEGAGKTIGSKPADLTAGKMYFWRVRSRAGDGAVSFFSPTAQFSIEAVTGVEKLDMIPETFDVAQNYPNPFNPETTIRYSVPEASFVSIKIYNALGQEVKTLLNREMNAGVYNVKWSGDDNFGNKVSSGTYIYRVVAGSKVFNKKMVLLK
ncbi:MAG: T9SS type A sorting domain-containing protein [Melioribacteraceae bacterium]|nr:T9SS type A sorting domain-containing protein [Melioribacteraceae bacterium]